MPDETTRSAIARLEAENAALRAAAQRLCDHVARPVAGYTDEVVLVLRSALNELRRALGPSDPPAPFTLIVVDDLAAAELCDAAAARLRTGRPGNDAVETVARCAVDASRQG